MVIPETRMFSGARNKRRRCKPLINAILAIATDVPSVHVETRRFC